LYLSGVINSYKVERPRQAGTRLRFTYVWKRHSVQCAKVGLSILENELYNEGLKAALFLQAGYSAYVVAILHF